MLSPTLFIFTALVAGTVSGSSRKIRAASSASSYAGSSASSGAYGSGGGGSYGSNGGYAGAGNHGSAGYGVPGAYNVPNFGNPGFGFPFGPCAPGYGNDPMNVQQQIQQQIQNLQNYHRELANRAQAGSTSGDQGVGAYASGNISPQGGQGEANISPKAPGGLDFRFGDNQPSSGPVNSAAGNFPPPSGNNYGISTHSSSSSSNVDGKTKTFKTSSVSVNDNGKVTTYTAHDP